MYKVDFLLIYRSILPYLFFLWTDLTKVEMKTFPNGRGIRSTEYGPYGFTSGFI